MTYLDVVMPDGSVLKLQRDCTIGEALESVKEIMEPYGKFGALSAREGLDLDSHGAVRVRFAAPQCS